MIRDDRELAEALRAAVLGDVSRVLAELYRTDGLPSDVVPLVTQIERSMKDCFEQLRTLVAPVTCELTEVVRTRTSVAVTMVLNGASRWRITVDDTYIVNGALRTHDSMEFEPLDENQGP